MDHINIKKVEIEGTDLVRDLSSNAILSTSVTKLNAYKNRKKISMENKEKLDKCVDDINMLKDEIGEIKTMLRLLTSKFN